MVAVVLPLSATALAERGVDAPQSSLAAPKCSPQAGVGVAATTPEISGVPAVVPRAKAGLDRLQVRAALQRQAVPVDRTSAGMEEVRNSREARPSIATEEGVAATSAAAVVVANAAAEAEVVEEALVSATPAS
jgi:hypothetical protein